MGQQHHEYIPPEDMAEEQNTVSSSTSFDPAVSAPETPHPRKRKKGHILLTRLCAAALMTSLAVIFCRLLGFPQSGIWRVEISFLPIAFVAFLWGPIWAGVTYGTADLIGAAISTGVNPFITIEKVFIGVVMGVLFWRGRSKRTRIGIVRILLAFAIIAVFGDFLMMAFIFKFAFGYTWSAALLFRGVNASVNLVMRCLLMWICDLRLTTRLLHEGDKFGV